MLLPFAAKAAAPLAGSLLSGILGKYSREKMAFKKSILISNDIWEKVKSNNNNFSSIKKKKKNHHPLPSKNQSYKKTRSKTSNYTETFYKIRVEWKGKRTQEKSNLMKNGKF